jgi:hypothetical protein
VSKERVGLEAIPEPVKAVARKLYRDHKYPKPRNVYDTQIMGEVTFAQINEAIQGCDDAEEAFWQVLALLDNHGYYCHP